MSIEEIIQIVIIIILGCYVLADCILKIVKRAKGDDEIEWKAQLSFAADLIERGIDIPKEIMIKLLRHKLSQDEYVKFVTKVQKENK